MALKPPFSYEFTALKRFTTETQSSQRNLLLFKGKRFMKPSDSRPFAAKRLRVGGLLGFAKPE